MKIRKYLTKSRFKVGLSCPRKLFYLDKPSEYADNKMDDPFLEGLARGGYQVGELAKAEYPEGVEVFERDHLKAVEKTKELLQQKNCIIFEAAFMFDSFFVRSDIVIKKGSHLKLIEVKSKSFDPATFREDLVSSTAAKKGILKLKSNWVEYIYDLAFQTWVARLAHPEFNVTAVFKAANKTKAATVDGLNSLYLIRKGEGQGFEITPQGVITPERLGESLLAEIELTDIVNDIIDGKEQSEFSIKKPFAELAKELLHIYLNNKAYSVKNSISSGCKSCEYRTFDENLKSGFNECWTEDKKVNKEDLNKPFVFDLGRFTKSSEFIEFGVYLLEQLKADDIKTSTGKNRSGLLQSDRQKKQLESVHNKSKEVFLMHEELFDEMASWEFPYHFIDFETCAPALPFTKNRRPYENVAFQFSHHVLHKDGRVEHVGQYINLDPGDFPNFKFVRELKKQLESDSGTIFRYSHHENTVLNHIVNQLKESEEPDAEELISFIRTITNHTPTGGKDKIHGDREMVDLCEMVMRFYYSPMMGGSVSIKYVLPAVLNDSEFLRTKYSQPHYGTQSIKSLNFSNKSWIDFTAEGEVKNPYHQLQQIFSPEDAEKIENFVSDDEDLQNGGAAMMAYCMTQFTAMNPLERERIKQALLRYCELDTLAMVMIVEYWRDALAQNGYFKKNKSGASHG